jgi:methyltransferase (TIGR00027 family)
MRHFISAVIYYALNILLFPALLAGYVIYVGKWFAGRKTGVSATAQAPLIARWLQHELGTRPDEPATRLLMVVPGISHLGLRLVTSPTLVGHRASGFVPKTFRYPFEGNVTMQNEGGARQTFFDGVSDRYLASISQFVILGAGFDTRAFRLKGVSKETQVHSFEIDTPQTQAVKRQMLEKAGIDATGITFVSADFETENWLTQLIDAGFDLKQPALFIMEGVIVYLDRAAAADTLRKIASTATGSIVAFDYFTTEVLESNALMMRSIRASLNAGGEPLKFGIDSTPPLRERVAELLQSCGLTLVEQRTLGQETGGKRAWGGFAIATVK